MPRIASARPSQRPSASCGRSALPSTGRVTRLTNSAGAAPARLSIPAPATLGRRAGGSATDIAPVWLRSRQRCRGKDLKRSRFRLRHRRGGAARRPVARAAAPARRGGFRHRVSAADPAIALARARAGFADPHPARLAGAAQLRREGHLPPGDGGVPSVASLIAMLEASAAARGTRDPAAATRRAARTIDAMKTSPRRALSPTTSRRRSAPSPASTRAPMS